MLFPEINFRETNMGDIKAKEILPIEIIELIQQYVDGESIYIPRKSSHRQAWGTSTQIKQKFLRIGGNKMSENIIFSQGSFFHGTKADLKIGDFIITGKKKNYNDDRKSEYVYFAGTLEAAIWGAELAEGDNQERIYVVEPTGDYENDPNLTDKKFPGNPTKSYRSKQPLKIVAEVIKWEGHSPEVLNNMIKNLRKLSENGIKAID